jgi:hypothetical protein
LGRTVLRRAGQVRLRGLASQELPLCGASARGYRVGAGAGLSVGCWLRDALRRWVLQRETCC